MYILLTKRYLSVDSAPWTVTCVYDSMSVVHDTEDVDRKLITFGVFFCHLFQPTLYRSTTQS